MANSILAPNASLRRLGAYKEYQFIPLEKEEVVIGRAKEATFNIADIQISRIHAIFRFTTNKWTIESVGMNGVLLNQEILPKNKPVSISNMDVLELGVGSKFMYSFRDQKVEDCEPFAKRMKVNLQSTGPSLNDTEAFQNWIKSKKDLERTLAEENESLEHKLNHQSSLEQHLTSEKEKTVTEAQDLVLKLKSQFHEEKKVLEDKVARGEMENKELQKLKEVLEEQMNKNLEEVMAKCSQKTQELEKELALAHREKQFLLEQKEIIVEQLQRENAILEERLNEEKRVSAAAVDELSKLRECREDLERKLEEERRKFEEERKCLVQQGIEATSRLHHLESKASQRSYQVQTTETQSTEHKGQGSEKNEFRTGHSLLRSAEHSKQDFRVKTEQHTPSSDKFHSSSLSITEVELERVRKELHASLAEKEKMQQLLESTAAKARMDAVGKLEDVVENELQCSICSELFVMATSLSCAHVFCSYCIESWKKTRKECPICRAPISSESRSILIDNAIDGIVASLSEEVQRRRKELISQRRQLMEKSSTEEVDPNERPSRSGYQSSSRGGRRGRSRGRGVKQASAR